MERSRLCRKPDDRGKVNLRCAHLIQKPRGESEPRQCRAAAMRGETLCGVHAHQLMRATLEVVP
jgi:hypothetical protein